MSDNMRVYIDEYGDARKTRSLPGSISKNTADNAPTSSDFKTDDLVRILPSSALSADGDHDLLSYIGQTGIIRSIDKTDKARFWVML